MRTCTDCARTLPADAYRTYRTEGERTATRPFCRDCERARKRAYWRENRTRLLPAMRANSRAYYASHGEHVRGLDAARRQQQTQERAQAPRPVALTAGRLREARKAAGLSQAQLGAAVGLSRAVVGDWEADCSAPSLAVAIAVARALGATVEQIWG